MSAGQTYDVNNGFTNGANESGESMTFVVGHKFATGANETPSVTHPIAKRQVIVGIVVNSATP